MIFNVPMDFGETHGKAIILEAKEKGISPEEYISKYMFMEDMGFNLDRFYDFVNDLVDKHNLTEEYDKELKEYGFID